MPQSNVVITGLGVVSSIGIGQNDYWQSLLEQRSGVCSLSQRTDDGPKPETCVHAPGLWIGGPVLNFDPKQYVRPRKALKVMCREIQTAYAASLLAIEHAGLTDMFPASPDGEIKPADVGTVFGCEMLYGSPLEMEDAVRACMAEDGTIDPSLFGSMAMKNITPLWMLKYLPNMPACHVGIVLNAHGPNNTQVLGDVSGMAAMIEAASCIQRGIAKLMITGASGTRINATRLNYRGDLPIPEVSDSVESSSRPHDPESKGVVGGEGAAAIVLEHAQHAAKRGRTPLASIVAYASRFVPPSGASPTTQRGSARAIRLAIEGALQDAGVSAAQIGLVVSHGMGDPQIDTAERDALSATVPGRAVCAPIATLGHTGAASGSMTLATAVLALWHGTVPPTPQTKTTAQEIGFRSEPEPLEGDFALAISHTSQGNATAVVLAKG